MSLSITAYGKRITAEGASRPERQPAGLEKTVKEFEASMQTEISQLQKQLKTAPAAQKQGIRDQIDRLERLMITDATRISGKEGTKLLFKAESRTFDEADAGHAKASSKNATLWVVGYGYETHRAMDGFLTDVPKDKKVTFNVICSPSSHAGSTEAEMEANFEKFARENEYIAEVYHEAADGTVTPIKTEQFKVKKGPEYATMSPDITVDLSKFKGGKLVVEGSAIGSAGVEGYVEARRTVIHL
jgi:hypothetical protein